MDLRRLVRAKLGALVERLLGPDEEETVEVALDEKDELDAKLRFLRGPPLPHFIVKVFWDPKSELFSGVIYAKPPHLDNSLIEDIEGETPGEVLGVGGAVLDAYLARRGFKRDERRSEPKKPEGSE